MYETNRICRLPSDNALNDSTDREAGNEAYDQQLTARQLGTPEILWDGCFGLRFQPVETRDFLFGRGTRLCIGCEWSVFAYLPQLKVADKHFTGSDQQYAKGDRMAALWNIQDHFVCTPFS